MLRSIVVCLSLCVFGEVYGQASAIPDGLDCENLTQEQAAYEEFCENAKSAQEAHESNRTENTDFWSGGEVNAQPDVTANDEYWAGGNATAEQYVSDTDYWAGANATDSDTGPEGTGPDAADPADAPKEVPWYNIRYECYASDAKGLEIRQIVKASGPEFLTIVVQLRFVDLHPKYHKNVLVARYTDFASGNRERWFALMGAGQKNGSGWTSPPIRIPRSWSWDRGSNPYTATWDDSRGRYRLSHWQDEEPYKKSLERELFAITVECYQYDSIDPRWKRLRM